MPKRPGVGRRTPSVLVASLWLGALLASAGRAEEEGDLDFLLRDEETAPERSEPRPKGESRPEPAGAAARGGAAPAEPPAEEEAERDAPETAVPADEPPPAAAASRPSRPGGRVIEEVIVTAQKREESLQEVPISMSVFDEEFLAREGITDLRELSAHVPNMSLDVDGFFLRPRMRGFATTGNEGFEQPIGLIVDGVAYGKGAYFQSALFDIERVEVLRGPQGTLFGKNTTVGLVNLVTRNPGDEFSGHVDVQIGDFERRRVEAAVGGPLLPGILNFRLAGLSDDRDGLVRNTTRATVPEANERLLGKDRLAFRGKVEVPDLLGANLVVGYERSDLELTGGGSELRLVPEDVRPFFLQHDPNTDFRPGNFVGSLDSPELNLRTVDTVFANAKYGLGGWDLHLVVGWSRLVEDDLVDGDFGPIPIAFVDSIRDNGQTTIELRLSSPGLPGLFGLERLFEAALGSSDVTVGFFYQNRTFEDRLVLDTNESVIAEFLVFQQIPTAGGLFPPGTIGMVDQSGAASTVDSFFTQDQNAIAGFAHANWTFLPRWTLLAGMRLSNETKDAFWDQEVSDNSVLIAQIFDEFTGRQSRSEFEFSPKAGARFDWTDDVNFYATWARSFRSGGFNATLVKEDPETREVDPEKVTSWEVGTKTRLLGGAATLNLGLFWTNLTDFQLVTEEATFILDAPVVVNVGEVRARGVEADFVWLPLSGLTLLGALGFNDTEFLEFPFGICEEDRTDTDGDGDDRCDLSGGPIERAPKWSITVTPRLDVPLTSLAGLLGATAPALAGIDLAGSFTIEYQDTQFLRETLDPRSRQGSFFRYDASLGFGDAARGWSAAFTVENLTDVATASLVEDVAVSTGTFGHFVEPPRLFFGSFRYRF